MKKPRTAHSKTAFYIGLMTGTSIDAIDAALIAVAPKGPPMLYGTLRHGFPDKVRDEIQQFIPPNACPDLEQTAALDVKLGELFAEAINHLVQRSGVPSAHIRAVGSHGQTLRHRPQGATPFTLQVGNPAVIAARTGITTVADFRTADIAAGGQGAPLVPIFHERVFRSRKKNRAILNIGGIANLTYLPRSLRTPVRGFDTGPGNTLLDNWIERHQDLAYDADGAWAAGGTPSVALLQALLSDPYFHMPPPKSTGREYFHLEWVQTRSNGLAQSISPQDMQATLCQLTAESIARAIDRWLEDADEVYVCGGGSHNRHLMALLQQRLGKRTLSTTETLGWNPDWVEAAAFGWLAHCALEGVPGNLPSVTGAKAPAILGGIYPAWRQGAKARRH